MTEQIQPENVQEGLPIDASHPDNAEIELASDAEVDALVVDIDPSAPVIYGEDDDE